MTLNQFRIQKGLTYHALAQLLDVKHATVVKRWCDHSVLPSKDKMQVIKLATMGSVMPNDFYNE
jgi:transcriptional regulator with XRE-family HTH domain